MLQKKKIKKSNLIAFAIVSAYRKKIDGLQHINTIIDKLLKQFTKCKKKKLTSAECLKRLQNNELEGNLTTIFGRLRNTNQYWLNPRSDIELMITWYGPVTFFLTLSPAEYNW